MDSNSSTRSVIVAAAAIVTAAIVPVPPFVLSAHAKAQDAIHAPTSATLEADTNIDLSGKAGLIAPRGWSLAKVPGGVILGAPERGSTIAILSRTEPNPDAAIAAAWARVRPDAPSAGKGEQRPPREGWDRSFRVQYAAPDGEPRTVMALALGKGEGWTVLLYDVTDAVSERRDAQIEVIFNSLLPTGYQRETFAGRKAHSLDRMRVAKLTAMIEDARTRFGIPGVALGLIQDGRVVFAGGFGVRRAGSTEKVNSDTLFNVASIGKSWTTLMLAKQVSEGRFGWDDPVQSLWPEFALGDRTVSASVKVRHLVCACTGMPRNDYGWIFEGDKSTSRSIMAALSRSQPTSAFGDTYQYSNLMAAAGGYFGGHMRFPREELGLAYDRAMQQLVFEPLRMTSTTADFGRALAGNHASGHAMDVEGQVAVASQALNLASVSTRPSGNHWSNVTDILRYIRMELARGVLPDGKRYIDEANLLTRSRPDVTEGLNEHYGMGLKIDRQWGVTVIHHGGSTAGYRSHMMWLPDHNVGAVILINSDEGAILRTAFRRRLLELLFDGAPVAERDLARMALLEQEAVAEERQSLTIPADPAAIARLAPRYRSNELGELRVYRDGSRSGFDFGGWKSEVASRKSSGGGTIFVTVTPGLDGFEFTDEPSVSPRRLKIREAQQEYIFEEVR